MPLTRDNLPGLVSNLAQNAINKFERKASRKEAVRAGRELTLFISNEDIIDIIKVIKSLEDSSVLIDGATETVKHEIKKKTRRWISSSFVKTFSRFISATNCFFSGKRHKWKRSQKSRKRMYKLKFLVLLHPLNNMKI